VPARRSAFRQRSGAVECRFRRPECGIGSRPYVLGINREFDEGGASIALDDAQGPMPHAALTYASFALLGAAAIASGRSRTRPESSHLDAAPSGRRIFEQRCGICHGTGERAAQGPGLGGVVGRRAASTHFGYSSALRNANLTWDRATLDRFLAAPAALVPGTTMPMSISDEAERRAVVDYLATLAAGDAPSGGAAAGSTSPVLAAPAPPALHTGRDAFGDFRRDGPGVRRHITIADLPPPYATPSARNGPDVVAPPPGAHPYVPPGFRADVFAHDLLGPRLLRVSPSGDLFVAESQAGRVHVLHAADGAREVERGAVFAAGLDRPFGIGFYPPGPDPKWVYVAETNAVVRFPYRNGDMIARGSAQTVVESLTSTPGGHWTRDVAFSNDGSRMFVSVGSASNVAEGDVDERDRADVLEFDPEGGGRQVFASGIRNCVGLAVHASTGDVWCSTNERDGLGDDLVPDYITRVRQGGFYGWPWYYLGVHEDPRHAGERPDLAGSVIVPDVLLQAHSASLQMTFYDATAFPAKYSGAAFASLHGSWNRGKRTGPKVIALPLRNGVPTGEYEDFMTGFVVDDDAVWARPVGVAVARDGSLFVSEDGNGTLWRIAFTGE
jgi:glucose/arabinose dehydrogenase